MTKKDIVEYAKTLPLEERGRLLATVKNAKTPADLRKGKAYIRKIERRAEERSTRKQIERELKDIKPKKDK